MVSLFKGASAIMLSTLALPASPVAAQDLDHIAMEMLSNLPTGVYFRPTTNISALYRRSPCPALNTLANHG